jgi:hypothetical protein
VVFGHLGHRYLDEPESQTNPGEIWKMKLIQKCQKKLFVITFLFIFPGTSLCNVEIPDKWEKSVVVIGQKYDVRHLTGEVD